MIFIFIVPYHNFHECYGRETLFEALCVSGEETWPRGAEELQGAGFTRSPLYIYENYIYENDCNVSIAFVQYCICSYL
ncbi:hypothetical protein [Neorickettsia helminthoeca]|uniref:hypothetical protein n=1 Tax=Neorickettsia helminthoeca TaxID=33994 RepID=UPI000ADFA552|nr:hypothetical protein [Neorickettsia helminthoeca]